MFRSTNLNFLALIALLIGLAGTAQAAPIVVPAGLSPGDSYRLAFVTSDTRDALSSDIADYNSFVTAAANAVAELAALGTTWRAIGSTAAVDARDNTNTNPSVETGVAIYSLDGIDLIAADNADLWDGTLATPIRETENGVIEINSGKVWTGTWVDGEGLAGATLGESFISVGFSAFPTAPWIAAEGQTPEQMFHVYAISGLLTVAPAEEIAEPSSLLILGLSAIGFACVRRRRPR